jgi:transcriptional regulator NrdR family protein
MVRYAIKCQKCGYRTRVISTRYPKDGTIRRTRFCPDCFHRQTTVQDTDGREGVLVIDYGEGKS